MLQIKRKDGFLTSYGMTCGYIEQTKFSFGCIYMYKEHGVNNVVICDTRKKPDNRHIRLIIRNRVWF
jgi:hypothetical protein